ncbi:MAG: hypothetical protein DRN26_06230 [Thermoplasmata archaeon]|nr:MAG: hypothetical protein DRN26_06230 [Thermoplasmata archaeon]
MVKSVKFDIFCFPQSLNIAEVILIIMWRSPICGVLSPNGRPLKSLRMWGVTVPPESQPMKMGGWKVSRNEIYELYGSCG